MAATGWGGGACDLGEACIESVVISGLRMGNEVLPGIQDLKPPGCA